MLAYNLIRVTNISHSLTLLYVESWIAVSQKNMYLFLKRIYKWPTNWKNYSVPLAIRETKIKTIMRYYLIPIRLGIITKKVANVLHFSIWYGY